MDTGQALTRFFQRNSEKANDLNLYPHKEEEFWLWMNSWAVFLQRPSDLGFSDDGYDLPPLQVRWHEVKTDISEGAGVDNFGQAALFRDKAIGVVDASREKRRTLDARIAKVAEIMAGDPDAHFLLWHDLEDERRALEALPNVEAVYGSQDLDDREAIIARFADGELFRLAAKPVMLGSGTNLQRHCHRAVFAGVGFKFNDFIQAIHRLHRFLQSRPVEIDIIYADTEDQVRRELLAKWQRDEEMKARMSDIIRRYGLNHGAAAEAMKRSIGVERKEVSGEGWTLTHNDCVEEARILADNSIDLIVTSIPFSNHYEYTPSYNDFGHTDDDDHFFAQLDFLTPELLRALAPGRLACIHVKDRILFGNVTGEGVPTVNPFHAKCIAHYLRHGFQYLGMVHVNTDVVRENNQTYRLSYSEMLKDGTKMGVGSPEYVLLMRKPQSDRTRGYADKPTHGRPDSPGVRSGRLLPWRTAAECIDWSIPCPSIFDRKRPLKDATNRRIAAGVMRYVVNAAKPFIVPVTHQGGVRVHDIDEPTRTVTGAHRGELAIVDIAVTGLGDPDEGPIGPGHVCKHGVRWPHPCDDCDQAAPPPGWSPHATLAPFASYGQHGGRNRPIDEPHHTIAASKKDTNGLVGATLVRTGHGEVDRHGKRRGKGHHDLTEPAPTVTSSRDEALVAATMVQTGYGERPGQAPRALDVEKPLGTLVAGGGKHAAVTAFLSSFYGSDRNNGGGDPTAPSKTVRAGGQHHAIVTAHIEQANGGQHNTNLSGRDARRPLSTVTTTGSQQRIVETTLIEEGALPPAMMERAVMAAAFLIKYYGNESGGHGLHAPIDTVTTRDRFAVVTVTIDQATYVIVDIGLRMLKPRELANAQGFPANYILDPVVPKVKRGKLVHEPLTIAKQISAIGNSVCPPVARALVAANQPGVAELRRAA